MQVVFAPQQKFFAARVTAVTPRRAAVERREVRKSLMKRASAARRAARKGVRGARHGQTVRPSARAKS
jgi:hypothetical protein